MPGTPYDSTLKALVETEPESWPALVGKPSGPTQVIDADIATVSGAADKVLRVAAKPAYLLHLEFVAGHDAAALPGKLLVRNSLLDDRHGLRVRSGAVLLRPEADSPKLKGILKRKFPDEDTYLRFRYHVVRVWKLSPEALLSGGLALLPLAPISAVTDAELPGIIERMGQRLKGRRGRSVAEVIWASAYVLFGLRHSPELAAQLFQGVVSMKESSTYQAILAEGRAEGEMKGAVAELRKMLRLVGDDAFGPPDATTMSTIECITELPQLEALVKRLRTAESWSELLAGLTPPRRRSGRRSPPA